MNKAAYLYTIMKRREIVIKLYVRKYLSCVMFITHRARIASYLHPVRRSNA